MGDGTRRALYAERLRIRDGREAHQKNWQPHLGRSFHGFCSLLRNHRRNQGAVRVHCRQKTFTVVVKYEWQIGETLFACNKSPRKSAGVASTANCRSTHKPVPTHSEAKRESSTELSTAHVECRVSRWRGR